MSDNDHVAEMREHFSGVMESLSLPDGHYVLFGSAVMQAAGIRYAHDIDIMVSEQLFNFCTNTAGLKVADSDYSAFDREVRKRVYSMLPAGHPKGNKEWPTNSSLKYHLVTGVSDEIYPMDFDTAFSRSKEIDGVRMLPIGEVMRWKFALVESRNFNAKSKHLNDISLIANYISESSN